MRKRNGYPRSCFSLGLFALFAAALPSTTAWAQEEGLRRGSQLISGFSGLFFDMSRESEDMNGEDRDGLEFESDWAFGGSYQYFLTPHLSLEASVTFGTGEGEAEGTGGDDPEDGDNEGDEGEEDGSGEAGEASARALYITGGIVYSFRPRGRWNPYVDAGAGLARISVDGRDEARPAGVFGGGLMLGMSQSLSVRVDVRDQLYTLDQGGSSSTRNNLSITGGVCFKF